MNGQLGKHLCGHDIQELRAEEHIRTNCSEKSGLGVTLKTERRPEVGMKEKDGAFQRTGSHSV